MMMYNVDLQAQQTYIYALACSKIQMARSTSWASPDEIEYWYGMYVKARSALKWMLLRKSWNAVKDTLECL